MTRIVPYDEFVEATDAIASPLLSNLGFTPLAPRRLRNSAYCREYEGARWSVEIRYEVRDALTDIHLKSNNDSGSTGIRFGKYLVSKYGAEIEAHVTPRKSELHSMLRDWCKIINEYRMDLV